ncbi:PH domain-containing protein [Arthrobacter pigmenti]
MTVQPDWYPDPQHEGQVRWWDGHHWTEHIQPMRRGDDPALSSREEKKQPKSDKQARGPKSGQLRGDIQRAKERAAGGLVGSGRELKKLESHLWEGEMVHSIGAGAYGGGIGLLALTDRRLLFLKDGIMSQVSEDFPFDKISSIQWHAGMIQGSITVFVSGNKAEIRSVAKDTGQAIVDTIRERISTSSIRTPKTEAFTPPPPSDDIIDQIKQLGELRDAGILTENEFSTKKAELLDRL